jgi:(+)-pinoresinol hydroxylase
MRARSVLVAAVLVLSFGAQRCNGQEASRSSAWTRKTISGEGQPKGYVQFENYCSMCHGPGPGQPGTMALQAKYKGAEPALLADRTDLNAAVIKAYVRNGDSIMPIFRKTEISDANLDLIAEYLTRNNKK